MNKNIEKYDLMTRGYPPTGPAVRFLDDNRIQKGRRYEVTGSELDGIFIGRSMGILRERYLTEGPLDEGINIWK